MEKFHIPKGSALQDSHEQGHVKFIQTKISHEK